MTAQALQAPVVAPLSRREFLYYIWGASMTLFMAQMGGAILWFAFPRFKEGEFGGIITVPVTDIPAVDSGPKDLPDARVWLVNLGGGRVGDPRQPVDYPVQTGVKALYKICVHLGCLYKWAPANDRFECPCHGSKYLTSGSRVDGPARRNLTPSRSSLWMRTAKCSRHRRPPARLAWTRTPHWKYRKGLWRCASTLPSGYRAQATRSPAAVYKIFCNLQRK